MLSSWEILSFAGNLLYFNFLKQDCYLGLNGFYDFGMDNKKYSLPDNLETTFETQYTRDTENFNDYFKPGQEKFHMSAGISIMLAMNQNFVIAIDIGKAFQ